MRILLLVAGVASLIAVANLPYSYYEMLRWLVTIACFALAFSATQTGRLVWLVLAIPAAIIWNPFFGLTMAKSSWLVFNLIAGAALIGASNDRLLLGEEKDSGHQ